MIDSALLLIIGIYYFIKTKSIERWFLVIGPLISFSIGIFNLYPLTNFTFENLSISELLIITSIIQFLGDIIFIIGFIMLVIKHLRRK